MKQFHISMYICVYIMSMYAVLYVQVYQVSFKINNFQTSHFVI